MTAQSGRDVLVKVDSTGAGTTFLTVGGGRSKSIALNATTVDVTDADSAGQWQEMLEGGGIKSSVITLSGVFKDSASEEDVRGYYFDQSHQDYQFVIPDFGTIEGKYQVTALTYSGEYNGEAAYSMTFTSAGAQTFTPAS